MLQQGFKANFQFLPFKFSSCKIDELRWILCLSKDTRKEIERNPRGSLTRFQWNLESLGSCWEEPQTSKLQRTRKRERGIATILIIFQMPSILQYMVLIYQLEIVWWCCWCRWGCHSKIVRNGGRLKSCWVEPLLDRTRATTEPRYHRQRHVGQANMAKRQEKWKVESGRSKGK